MNFKSIITKISIVFFITIILLITLFFAYTEYEKGEFEKSLSKKYRDISKHIHKNRMRPDEIVEFVKPFNLVILKEPKSLRNKGVIITAGRGYEALKYKEKFYFHFHVPHFSLIFKDTNLYEQNYIKYVVFIFLLFLFAFIYYLIIKNIKDTNLLLNSRQLFLRTVMHELKTPIAKGRIVSELIEDEKQKNRMIVIFEKLNYLINDFAKVEQIVSRNYHLSIYKADIKTIIQSSIESLMIENRENITIQILSNEKIDVDFELFCMVIKNLLDNALKYSLDKKVIIKDDTNRLLFISKGEKLSKPIEDYFKPFHNDTDAKTHGMGLGLYIIKSILDMHHFKFLYEYKDQENIFTIVFNK